MQCVILSKVDDNDYLSNPSNFDVGEFGVVKSVPAEWDQKILGRVFVMGQGQLVVPSTRHSRGFVVPQNDWGQVKVRRLHEDEQVTISPIS